MRILTSSHTSLNSMLTRLQVSCAIDFRGRGRVHTLARCGELVGECRVACAGAARAARSLCRRARRRLPMGRWFRASVWDLFREARSHTARKSTSEQPSFSSVAPCDTSMSSEHCPPPTHTDPRVCVVGIWAYICALLFIGGTGTPAEHSDASQLAVVGHGVVMG